MSKINHWEYMKCFPLSLIQKHVKKLYYSECILLLIAQLRDFLDFVYNEFSIIYRQVLFIARWRRGCHSTSTQSQTELVRSSSPATHRSTLAYVWSSSGIKFATFYGSSSKKQDIFTIDNYCINCICFFGNNRHNNGETYPKGRESCRAFASCAWGQFQTSNALS